MKTQVGIFYQLNSRGEKKQALPGEGLAWGAHQNHVKRQFIELLKCDSLKKRTGKHSHFPRLHTGNHT